MKRPVPLTEEDIGPEAELKQKFDLDEIRNRGYMQFFYHSKESHLPIRDVTNTQNQGWKMEPCIERKAENYCDSCYQPNINAFSKQDRRYLFLYTSCRFNGIEEDGDRFIIGYIEKHRVLDFDGRTAVQGPIKLVSFPNACPLEEVAPRNLRGAKKLGEKKTRRILKYLEDADNIYQDCVDAVEDLEKTVARPRLWEEKGGVPPEEESKLFDDASSTC